MCPEQVEDVPVEFGSRVQIVSRSPREVFRSSDPRYGLRRGRRPDRISPQSLAAGAARARARALAARDLRYVSAGTCASRSSFAVSSPACACFFAIRAKVGSLSLKKPPSSASAALASMGPALSDWNDVLNLSDHRYAL